MDASNHNHEPANLDELHDRLVDRGLAEVIGRQTPPDLATRILAACAPVHAASVAAELAEVRAAQATHKTRSSRVFWASLAVAATLLIAATLALLPSSSTRFFTARSAKSNIVAEFSNATTKSRKTQLVDGAAGREAEPPSPDKLMTGTAVNSDAGLTELAAENSKSNDAALPSPYYLTDDVQYYAPPREPAQKFRIEAAPGAEVQRYLVEHDRTKGNIGRQGVVNDAYDSPAVAPTVAATTSLGPTTAPIKRGANATARNRENVYFDLQSGQEPIPRANLAVGRDGMQTAGIPVTPGIINGEGEEERLLLSERPDKNGRGTGPGLPGDQYTRIVENPFVKVEGGAAVSTFSIDVDTASYANVRQFLMQMNTLPPPDAVRIEELINYFDYDYAGPSEAADTPSAPGSAGGPKDAADSEDSKTAPFAAHFEVAGCPWASEHRLVRIGIKGREIAPDKRPPSNLVFLVDVSGSMNEPAKLPLVVYGLQQLTRELGENDRVAIVVYASSEGLVLPSTTGDRQDTILAALGKLQAGGSTAGGAGIQLAYQLAEDNFIEGGTNRVILCTDGDFNVGVTSTAELERMVEQKAKDTKVFLSVLGFGRGNLNDAMMEAISNHGNGNYSYVDNRTEARRVLVEEMAGTLVTIAKDVKIQVEFNPRQVAGYRLIGYENRMLRTEDFNDDKKDAGEIGAGHTVTALYEIVPAGKPVAVDPVDDLKYQQPVGRTILSVENERNDTSDETTDKIVRPTNDAADIEGELFTLKMRYKQPDGNKSRKLEWPVTDDGKAYSAATGDFQFAAAVAGFGLLLRDSQHKGNLTYAAALELAQAGIGSDERGYRGEFLEMIGRAKTLRAE